MARMSTVGFETGVTLERRECRIPVAVIRRAIEAEESPEVVGARYGFTGDRVRKHAEDLGMAFANGVVVAKRAFRKVPDDATLLACFRSARPVDELAKSWGVSAVTAYDHRNRLARAGLLIIDASNGKLVLPKVSPAAIETQRQKAKPVQLSMEFMGASS